MSLRPYVTLFRRNPDYRRVEIATLVTMAGDWFAVVPLLDLLAAASPYAGTVADRVDRRRIMIVTELLSAPARRTTRGQVGHPPGWHEML